MGRIERTKYSLAWFQSEEMRRRVTCGLNKGEAKHALDRAVFFHRRGMVHDRSVEDHQHRASGLTVVTAAIVLWNTLMLEEAVTTLRAQGITIHDDHLAHLSPLSWEKIILTGEYRWNLQPAHFLRQRQLPLTIG